MFRQTLSRLKAPQLAADFPINLETLGLAAHGPAQQPPGQAGGTTTPHAAQGFSLSETAAKFARRANIGHPFALRILPGQKSKEFPIRISICPRHTFSFYHLKYLGPFDHPLIDKMIHFYTQEKRTKPLWCYVHGFSATDGSNSVVRQSSERAVRAALFKALNAAGYDSHGRSLDGSKQNLHGTIRVTVLEPKAIMRKLDFEKLVGYLSGFVPDIVPRLSSSSPKPSHGRGERRQRTNSVDSVNKDRQ
ncbi:uncharacterized protein P884DRAFT_49599 [Thermothelomyces heterothallicus CBS 202.75]|uniref:uncharacterized protein n=1 Tax=Thermothelomyces heterothallicus CBS 202.75 TaxID=1149848 RepID=UPI003743A7C6